MRKSLPLKSTQKDVAGLVNTAYIYQMGLTQFTFCYKLRFYAVWTLPRVRAYTYTYTNRNIISSFSSKNASSHFMQKHLSCKYIILQETPRNFYQICFMVPPFCTIFGSSPSKISNNEEERRMKMRYYGVGSFWYFKKLLTQEPILQQAYHTTLYILRMVASVYALLLQTPVLYTCFEIVAVDLFGTLPKIKWVELFGLEYGV